MQLGDDLKAELLKQFPAEVVEVQNEAGEINCVCPTCKRAVTSGLTQCTMCNQKLVWNNIMKKKMSNGGSRARIEFNIPADFTRGDCRKCPMSYIVKREGETSYDCPLNMRNECKLEII